jgi:hypothetical protein
MNVSDVRGLGVAAEVVSSADWAAVGRPRRAAPSAPLEITAMMIRREVLRREEVMQCRLEKVHQAGDKIMEKRGPTPCFLHVGTLQFRYLTPRLISTHLVQWPKTATK